MRWTLLAVVALLGLAAPAVAGDVEYRTIGVMGGGTIDVPVQLLADQPVWAAGYDPVVDGKGSLWLFARLTDGSLAWVQPASWKGRVMGGTNYGVDLSQSTQAAGSLVTNDPTLGQELGSALGTSTSTDAEARRPWQPSLVNVNTDGLIVGGALVAAALLIGLGLRRSES